MTCDVFNGATVSDGNVNFEPSVEFVADLCELAVKVANGDQTTAMKHMRSFAADIQRGQQTFMEQLIKPGSYEDFAMQAEAQALTVTEHDQASTRMYLETFAETVSAQGEGILVNTMGSREEGLARMACRL